MFSFIDKVEAFVAKACTSIFVLVLHFNCLLVNKILESTFVAIKQLHNLSMK